jgi:hypothetical protein
MQRLLDVAAGSHDLLVVAGALDELSALAAVEHRIAARRARACGYTWGAIASSLGLASRQAAHRRYRKPK